MGHCHMFLFFINYNNNTLQKNDLFINNYCGPTFLFFFYFFFFFNLNRSQENFWKNTQFIVIIFHFIILSPTKKYY